MKVDEGLVGIADTRITTGSEVGQARKLYTFQRDQSSLFMMTSGLRSIRDKAITYFEESLTDGEGRYDRLYKAVNAFSRHIRQVSLEDKEALEESGLRFNIHALIGGQFEHDSEHKLYLIYPQGNWIEIAEGTPYHIIGASGYGKPILDRTLHYNDPMRHAFKVGCLAFDSTRISAADVDYPIDIVLYPRNSFRMVEHTYRKDDLADITTWWQERLRRSIKELPSEWIDRAFAPLTPLEEFTRPPLGLDTGEAGAGLKPASSTPFPSISDTGAA